MHVIQNTCFLTSLVTEFCCFLKTLCSLIGHFLVTLRVTLYSLRYVECTPYSVERGIDDAGRLLDIFGLGEGVATSNGCAYSKTPELQQI